MSVVRSVHERATRIMMSRVEIHSMVVIISLSLFTLSACSSFIPLFGPPDGYLAVGTNNVAFIQFTEQQNQLTGHMEDMAVTNDALPQTETHNSTFTGSKNGSSMTITFSELWTSTSFTGTFDGNILTLGLPQDDGHIMNVTFNGASVQQYNQAIDALQKQVAKQDQDYYDAQTRLNDMRATATAVQDRQDAVSSANDHLSDALESLKSNSSTLAAFSETSTVNGYANDWQNMQKDYTTEQNDAAKGCGDYDSNYRQVDADGGQVDADGRQIDADDRQIDADKNQYDSDLSPVQDDIQAVQTDWASLQNAVKANTSGTPAPAYTQSDIDIALTNAQNAKSAALSLWQSAQSSAATYDSEAKDLQQKADAIPASMKCS
jgi:hypothetical protein